MGLTYNSTGLKTPKTDFCIKKHSDTDKVIALAGNPNVGKSTVFNALTGLHQHTGNWAGKTVSNAQGYCEINGQGLIFVDIPGTYSLMAHSTEEEVARNFICFGNSDAVILVSDATCLERNLNLVLQTLEITENAIVCVNLLDEAKKKDICIDLNLLEKRLGVPCIGASARTGKGLDKLLDESIKFLKNSEPKKVYKVVYSEPIEKAISIISSILEKNLPNKSINLRFISLRLIDNDQSLMSSLNNYLNFSVEDNLEISKSLNEARTYLLENGYETENEIKDSIVSSIIHSAETICKGAVSFKNIEYNEKDRKIDKILTNKITGFPIMIALLCLVFYITIRGANYPSELLSKGFFFLEEKLFYLLLDLQIPLYFCELFVHGMFRVLSWVIAVMLPPMAIFFPLFTLLEDLGYLPRVAFNLDNSFKKCCACGKQALTMCMGFGCNAAGIIGCRIIDSPRERLIAIITNNFVPCNGRFPTLISIITMFFVASNNIFGTTLLSTLILTFIIIVGIFMTFVVSKLLSKTVLKGEPSSFTLELPPYRKPRIAQIIVHSIFDRTLFVLGRAILVAAPVGIIIWLMANTYIDQNTILSICSNFLDPFGKICGMDGVIILAFILGFPANEIVVPIIVMAYMANGSLVEMNNLSQLKLLLLNNGWTWVTAICTMMFSLMHFPCSTTLLTIKQETKSFKWTLCAFITPTIIGIIVCIFINIFSKLFYIY